MDRPHHPHVIRTWTVERTRHPVREAVIPRGRKAPGNLARTPRPEPPKRP